MNQPSRPEARCLITFDATAQQLCFPSVQQAARLTRFIDRSQTKRPPQKPPEIETEWLLCSRARATFSAAMMVEADRKYWGIENGLHLRLDVSAGEAQSGPPPHVGPESGDDPSPHDQCRHRLDPALPQPAASYVARLL